MSEELTKYKEAKVLVATPNFSNLFTAEAFQSHVNCVAEWTKNGIDFNWTVQGRTFVHFARTQACQAAMDGGFTHIFWLDDDALIEPDVLPKLIEHDVDVVMLPYPMRRSPFQIGVLSSTVGDFHDHESYRNFEIADLNQGLIEVDGGGTHAMLCKVEALKVHGDPTSKQAYPDELLELIKELNPDQRKIIDHYVGDLPDESLSMEEEDCLGKPYFMMPKSGTEDMYFCYRLKKKGVKIWCDTDLFANHIGFAPVISRAFREQAEKALAKPKDGQNVVQLTPASLGRDHTHIKRNAVSNLV